MFSAFPVEFHIHGPGAYAGLFLRVYGKMWEHHPWVPFWLQKCHTMTVNNEKSGRGIVSSDNSGSFVHGYAMKTKCGVLDV